MTLTLIDTHNHVDAGDFDADRDSVLGEAQSAGVRDALICAGYLSGFAKTQAVARAARWHYALGLHPLFLSSIESVEQALEAVREQARQALNDPLFAAVGEIGLDGYEPDVDQVKQEAIFIGQLKIARALQLPVSVHARHAVDRVAAGCARIRPTCGVVHAFNGSIEQAQRLLGLGLKLGFGGAMLYSGSLRIRRVFSLLPDHGFVLETDSPDMPGPERRQMADARTHPSDMAQYLLEAARLRHCEPALLAQQSTANALAAFPRLAL